MEKYKVFYSWESDLPNATNRNLIERALEDAAKAIRADESIKIEPVIDRDTAGVPGSPDIANTIFGKIEQSQVFACDVSIINKGEKSRKAPNPNVLIELGYA
ncbi:MAG: nucleotide-binding protein, partial [Sedimentisphaerales bacterium]|nr:nucleotide-binding protein [Sedimentisphaerales bacterium]